MRRIQSRACRDRFGAFVPVSTNDATVIAGAKVQVSGMSRPTVPTMTNVL